MPKLRGLPRRKWTEHWRETGKETGAASTLAARDTPSKVMLSVASPDTRTSLKARNIARILVVDDEAHVRSMIAATLERQGYEVMLASGGREALEAIDQGSFELILTDIVMQEGNGLALLERIHGQNPNLPVIMVTAIHDISVAIDS
ncbi:MAG: response regulator, partial [Terracidiphilus sp.]